MLALDQRSSVTHHLVTHFRGDLDDNRLEEAWQAVGKRHPILRARLCRDDGMWRPGTGQLGFALLPVSGADHEEAVVQAVCASRLGSDPVDAGRLTMIRRGGDGAVVVMSLHHAIVDGRGAFVVFDDLRSLYRDALRDGRVESGPVDGTPRTMAAAVAAAALPVEARAEIVRQAARRWADAVPSSHCAPNGHDPHELAGVQAFRLTPSPLSGLASIRRNRGWSATDVILGALARAWEEALGRDHTASRTSGWLVTADVRPRLGLTRGVGNLSGTEPVALRGVGSGPPEHAVAVAAAALRSVRRGHPGLGADLAAAELEALGLLIPQWLNGALLRLGTERSRYTRAVANFGVLPERLSDWGSATLDDLWWAPPLADPPYVNATFTTVGDTLTLSLRTHPRGITASLATDLAAAFEETLVDLAVER